jgi:hypothetical protein
MHFAKGQVSSIVPLGNFTDFDTLQHTLDG